VAAEVVKAARDKNVVEGEGCAEDDGEEKNEAGRAKGAQRGTGLLSEGALLRQLQLDEAQKLFRIGRFVLAVTVGIHRERILTNGPKYKWILSNEGQT
jgi:hypothetical protein